MSSEAPETYSIQQVSPESFHLLVPLMQDCFGIDTDIEYFRWKYTRNPAGSFIGFIAVADTTGEVGAYYGVIPELFTRHGQRQIVHQSCDTMTHSRHRRRGLFQMLAVHCYNYLREQGNGQFFIYGYGGAQSLPGFIKFGWHHLFDIGYFFYARQFKWLDLNARLAPARQVALVTDYAPLADLLLQHSTQVPVHSRREPNQFAWRLDNPRHDYQTLASYGSDGRPDGYLIFYREPDKLFLFDFFANNKAAERALFQAVKRQIEPGMKGIVALSQKSTPFTRTLGRNLFVNNPFKKGPLHETIPFIIYADDAAMAAEAAPAHWAMGAYDNDAL